MAKRLLKMQKQRVAAGEDGLTWNACRRTDARVDNPGRSGQVEQRRSFEKNLLRLHELRRSSARLSMSK